MNRRLFIALSLVSFSLIACFCGGTNRQAPAPTNNAKTQQQADKPPVVNVGPDPVFTFSPVVLPPRDFTPIMSASLRDPDSIAAKIKVELLSAAIEDRRLNVQLRITNEGRIRYDYRPWPKSTKGPLPHATDEHGNTFAIVSADVDDAKQIEPDKSIVAVLGFQSPLPTSQEVDVHIPGEVIASSRGNPLLAKQVFRFKIGRALFAKVEDERLAKEEYNRQFAAFQNALAAKREERRIAQEIANQKHAEEQQIKLIEEEKENQRKADRARVIAEEKEEARKEAAKRAKMVASRENYNKLETGIWLADAQKICGPARERARSGDLLMVTWSHKGCVISATFRGGYLISKAIAGD